MRSLSFYAYSYISGLKNDKYTSSESCDLVFANCHRAKRPSGEATFGRNDAIPCKRGSEGMLIASLNFPVDDSFVRSKQFASGSSFK